MLGFALDPHSTVFAQLMHGISKVMLIVGVYGAARSLGVGTLALLAAALVASDEHIVASGANGSVRPRPVGADLIYGIFALVIFIAKSEKNIYF